MRQRSDHTDPFFGRSDQLLLHILEDPTARFTSACLAVGYTKSWLFDFVPLPPVPSVSLGNPFPHRQYFRAFALAPSLFSRPI